jgi:hypothetical protein
MAELTDELVVGPMRAELEAYGRATDGITRARG